MQRNEETLFGQSLAFNTAIVVGLLVTAVIGVIPWVIGIITNTPVLFNAWGMMAKHFAVLMVGSESPPKIKHKAPAEVPVVTARVKAHDYIQRELDGGRLLCIMVKEGRNGNIGYQRFVREAKGELTVIRQDLSPIVPGELEELGFEVNLESALDYTLKQIRKGVLKGLESLAEGKPSAMAKPEVPASPAAQSAPASVPPAATHLDGNGAGVNPADQAEGKAQQHRQSATGKVVSAEVKTVSPQGRRSYKAFTVTLIDPKAGEVSFSGVDLQERFIRGDFAVGDTISVKKGREHFTVTHDDGSANVRTKNVFEITRIA
ncbi:hypothetical protein [Hydrogenophaga sp. NFH-34]|uniref:hypothetical protein n=1 Tax=Hydrogenophaga sp. NFH-34 TaxID=2744446 RepID=UPI001F1DDEEA|nr:hypothetical protein [Hydrogenophaga sp. NFH-34]